MAIELQPGETALGNWAVHHEAPGGRPVSGQLHITNLRVVFEAQMEAGGRGLKQARQVLSSNWKANNSVVVDRDQIAGVDLKKGFLSKRITVSTTGGAAYVFNRGIISVDPLMAALQKS